MDAATGALTLVGAGDCVVTVTAAGPRPITSEANDTFTVEVRAAGTLALNVNAIAGDNTINIAERLAGFAIAGDTGTETGVTVIVGIGATTLNGVTSDGAGAWSVGVPGDAAYITGASVAVSVSASKTGFTSPSAERRALTVDLVAPTPPAYTAPGSLTVGVPIAAMNPSGGVDVAAHDATGLPPGLGIDTASGAIGGTPGTANASTALARVTVTDTAGNPATVDIAFPAVDKGDQALAGFQYGAASVRYGDAAPAVTPPTGERGALSYSASPDTVCTVVAATGALTLVGAGDCVVTVTAAGTDDYNEASDTFTVAVQPTGTLVLNVSAIAGDGTVNIAEKASGFAISGDTGSEGGVDVTVTVGGTDLTAASADANPATWSVSVPGNASYIAGTSVAVAVNASKTGYSSPSAERRTLTVDLVAPTPPAYTAPGSLTVGVPIAAMNPSGGAGIDEYAAPGLPSGLGIDTATGRDRRHAGHGRRRHRRGDGDGERQRRQRRHGGHRVPGGGQGRSDARRVPVQQRLGGVRRRRAGRHAPHRGAGRAELLGESGHRMHGRRRHRRAHPGGRRAVRGHGHGGGHRRLQRSQRHVHRRGAAHRHAGAERERHRHGRHDQHRREGVRVRHQRRHRFGGRGGRDRDSGRHGSAAASADANPATWSVSVPGNASYIAGTSVAVAVNASKTGYSPPSAKRRTLTVDLVAPTPPGYTAPSSLTVGVPIAAMNPSGGVDVAAHDATGLPPGLGIDTASGAIDGTPGTANASTALARVTVTDTAGNTDTVDIAFSAVAKGDQALSGFRYGAASVRYGDAAPAVTPPTGERGALSYSAAPATVCTVDAGSGALALVDAGECVVTVTAASTADYNEANAVFTVTVQPTATLVLNVPAIAGDDTINIAEKASGFAIAGDTGTETGVTVTVGIGAIALTATSADDAGTAAWSVGVPGDAAYITGTSVEVSVSAAKTGFASPSAERRTVTVDLVAPTPPAYTAPNSLTVGVPIAAMNPTGGAGIEEYSAPGLPPGLSIDPGTGAIGGTPDTAEAGAADATVTVTDTAGNPATVDIAFPAVGKGDQALAGFQYGAASVRYGDAAPAVTPPTGERGALSYSAAPATVCTVDAGSGALALVDAGECVVTVTAASTADYNEASAAFTVTVQPTATLVLNVPAIAGDDTINIAEKASGFAIAGDTGTETGVTVTVGIGAIALTATSADDAGTAAWSVGVPGDAAYITGTSVEVSVSAAKTGFASPSAERRTVTVDLVAPTPPAYTAPSSLTVGVPIAAMNPTGGAGIEEYSAPGLPPGLSIDRARARSAARRTRPRPAPPTPR